MTAGALLAALAPAWAGPPADQALIPKPACPADRAFGGLPVRSVEVRTPLAFLPWIQSDQEQAKSLAAPLAGQPYRADAIEAVQEAIGRLPFAQLDREARVGARVRAVIVNCTSQGLDLVFFVFAVNASKSIAATWESRQRETAAPEEQAGQESLRQGLRLQPRLGYQAGEGAGGGLAALYKRSDAGDGAYWRTLAVNGYASDRQHDLSVAIEGERDPVHGPWAHLSWRLAYADQAAPARSVSRLGQSGLEAQLLAQTRPLGALALPWRLGAALDAGQRRSGGQDNPAAGLAANAPSRSLKLMAGTTARLERQSFAASYAVEFGGRGGVDWIKQIVDVAHQGRWLVSDHRNLSLDTRVSFGRLGERGVVPAGTRFYAGGREQRFTGGDQWQIRGAPLLRSLGTNGLAGDAASPGYQRFAALNLTAALPVYNVPLLPAELYSDDSEVLPLMHAQLDSAASTLEGTVRSELPSYRQAIAHLPQVQQTLAAMGSAVAAAEPAAGSAALEAFTACRDQVEQARSDVAGVLKSTGISQLGLLVDLLPPTQGSDTLGQVAQLCADQFNASAGSPQITQQGAALRASVVQLEQWFAAASPEAAKAAAKREIEPVRRIVDTLFKEINIVAVSPLLMLDVVGLGPRGAGAPRTRNGLGTGLRVTLVDSVDFSLGYMANLRRQPGEARGAFFLAMEIKDPF